MEKVQKSTILEYQKRIAIVTNWLLNGEKQINIIHNSLELWGIKQSQTERYIAEARAVILSKLNKNTKEEAALHIERRETLYREAMRALEPVRDKNTREIIEEPTRAEKAALVKTALMVDQDSAKLKGLYVEKKDISVKTKIDLNGYTIEQLRELSNELDNADGDAAEFEDIIEEREGDEEGHSDGGADQAV